MSGKVGRILATLLWSLLLFWAYWLGPRDSDEAGIGEQAPHDAMYHMHWPLHPGGKVSMAGHFHLELASEARGIHHLWISNAFRQEMDPAGFQGSLKIELAHGEMQEAFFQRVGRGTELRAVSRPLRGQAWLTLTGRLGQLADFSAVTFFWDYDSKAADMQIPLGLDPMLPVPAANTLTPGRVALGKALFFDPLLSADGTISCATCHRPEHAFAEDRAVARGIAGRLGRRNTPTLLNAAYQRVFFWDGRSMSLEEQAMGPILSHLEMGINDEAGLLARLTPRYKEAMEMEFDLPLSLQTVAMALSCYERTLLSGDSDFDRYEAGQREAISVAARRGRTLFFGKARCGHCHIPPLFTDYGFHNLGVGWPGGENQDRGRYEVTGEGKDLGAFKTPTLRDVSRTLPYMHDGSLATLRQVIEFYNRGCRPNPNLDLQIESLNLTNPEIDDLLAFLKTLDGREVAPSQSTPAKTTTLSQEGVSP